MKHPKNARNAIKKFNELAEAYEVLSTQEYKQVYDQFGYEWLQEGVPSKDDVNKVLGGYYFKGNAFKIFENVFGTINPFLDVFSGLPCGQKEESLEDDLNVNLEVSLEEMYFGCQKLLKYAKKQVSPSLTEIVEIETEKLIDIYPGMGNEPILLPGYGNEVLGKVSSDLYIHLKAKMHPHFKRDRNNLIFTAKIPLVHATTLDGRQLTISLDEIVQPNTVMEIKNEGMPIYKSNSEIRTLIEQEGDYQQQRGDLLIHFDIQFPDYITGEQKLQLRDLLEGL